MGVGNGKIGIGVVGCGYWGPNHIRNFDELPGSRVQMVVDLDEGRLAAVRALRPSLRTSRDFADLLRDDSIAAVVIATPPSTHANLAHDALLAGKHVLVEKPMALRSDDIRELIQIADARGLVLMAGHTFLFNPAVHALRELVTSGELGDIYYAHTQRLNLGVFQRDVNVVWDLATHDITILSYVLGMWPLAAAARGTDYVQAGIPDVASVHLTFPGRIQAYLHVSWLDPAKVRRITVVGTKKMAVYDDVETLEKIRLYNKGVESLPYTETFGEFQLSYRYGEINIPHLPSTEPMRLECQHFLDCIANGVRPLSDGVQGKQVVEVLEAIQASLDGDGRMVRISDRVNGLPTQPVSDPSRHGRDTTDAMVQSRRDER